jgi:NAD(P)-dependent dehydrogenase (short-subunit alcohol dehydrogenase family)
MSREGDVKRLIAEFVSAEGRLDSLINMAGILRSTHVTETTLDQFMEVIKVNLASFKRSDDAIEFGLGVLERESLDIRRPPPS